MYIQFELVHLDDVFYHLDTMFHIEFDHYNNIRFQLLYLLDDVFYQSNTNIHSSYDHFHTI